MRPDRLFGEKTPGFGRGFLFAGLFAYGGDAFLPSKIFTSFDGASNSHPVMLPHSPQEDF
jgi:hypothetical protein